MKKYRSRPGMLAAVMILAFLLPGCASNESIINGNAVSMVQEAPGSEELIVWHTYSDEEAWKFEHELVPLFEKEHPDIRVRAVKQPYETMKGALIAQATAKKGPDVVRMDMAWVPEFAKLGLLFPISELPEYAAIEQTLHQTAVNTNRYKGRHYGLPLNLNTKVGIYNLEVLHQTGLQEPPKTMDELISLVRGRHLTIGLGGIHTWGILPYFMGLGGTLTDPDYKQASGYLNSAKSKQVTLQLKSLVEEGIFANDFLEGKADRWDAVQDADSNLLMIDEGPWFYSILSRVNHTDFSELLKKTVPAPFPHNSGTKAAIIGGENLVLMNGSKHQQAAWTFMKWMTDVGAQQLMFDTGLIPANLEAAEEAKNRSDAVVSLYVNSLDDAFLRPPVPNWDKIDKAFNMSFDQMLRGEADIPAELDRLAEQIDLLLAS
ncbi:extracellular solute-binding protein [Paenibacillus gansuensis]|uniref:Extracellular solute-binding protein n=1 Tax=Paenibacillus gansuensis TaxID=306542 RepID=A0ABW5PMN4_9BACL